MADDGAKEAPANAGHAPQPVVEAHSADKPEKASSAAAEDGLSINAKGAGDTDADADADADADEDADADADADEDVDMQDAPHDDPTDGDADADGEMDAEGDEDDDVGSRRNMLTIIENTERYLSGYKDDDGNRIADAFQRILNKRLFPSYYDVIKEPVAFSTIRVCLVPAMPRL